jgi:hypothetical protein
MESLVRNGIVESWFPLTIILDFIINYTTVWQLEGKELSEGSEEEEWGGGRECQPKNAH